MAHTLHFSAWGETTVHLDSNLQDPKDMQQDANNSADSHSASRYYTSA